MTPLPLLACLALSHPLAAQEEGIGGAPPELAPAPVPPPPVPPPLAPPKLEKIVEAPYPMGLDLGEVRVELQILVDETGAVERVDVITGEEPFASLALFATRQFRFQPARENGQPTAVELPFTYVFPPPPVNLHGTLRVRGSGVAAAGVQVVVGGRSVVTDAEGRFELRNVAPGETTLRLSEPSLLLDPLPLRILPGEVQELALWATPDRQVGELVGTWERERNQVIRRSLTAEEVRTTPGTLGDPVRAVQNLPGLVRTPLDAGWLLVRGGDPEDTGLYLDGIRVPLVFHLLGLSSVIHPAFVDRVDFFPGSYGARYGRATGGAVNLVSRPAHEGDSQLVAGADLVAASVFTRVKLGRKGGFAAAVRRSYLDGVIGGIGSLGLFGLSEGSEQIAPRYWDWQARFDRPRWGVFALGYTDRIYAPTTSGETVSLEQGTQRVHGHLDLQVLDRPVHIVPILGEDTYHLTYAAYDDTRTRSVYGGRVETPDDGRGEWGWSAGVDVELGEYTIAMQTEYDPRPISTSAAYGSTDPYVDVRIGETHQVVLGARLETLFLQDQLPRAMPSPRLQGRFPSFYRNLDVLVGAGMYHQWPPLDEAVGLPGGFDLRLERSWGADVGGHLTAGIFDLETTVYGRKLEQLAVVEYDGTLGMGSGYAYGVENLWRWDADPVAGWLSYTWSRSYRQEDVGNPYLPYTWDQPHYLVAVATWSLPRQWTLAGRFRFGSGYPHDPDETEGYDLLYQERRCLAAPDVDPSLAWCPAWEGDRLPPFHALDLKVARRFLFRAWTLDAWLDLQNLYNRRIPEPVITDTLQVDTVYSYGLPFLPVVGLKGVFRP